jgi:Protein of unknown function (DUF2721)
MIAVTDRIDSVAHVIQVALTPVFLLSGVASLLGVLSTRLARVADRVDALIEKLEVASPLERGRLETRLAYLDRRSKILDVAVILATLGGVMTSAAALLLFVDTLRSNAGASLFIAFGLALLMTIGALICFLLEMLMASKGIRKEASKPLEEPDPAEPPEEMRTEASEEVARADGGATQG